MISNEDLSKVIGALLWLHKRSRAPQMRSVDVPVAVDHLVKAAQAGHLVAHDGYGILFDVGPPWYTTQPMLIEELVIRIGPSIEGPRGAVRHLTYLARQHGCTHIAAGDTQLGRMDEHYIAEGFTFLGRQFFKEVPDGLCPKDHGGPGAG